MIEVQIAATVNEAGVADNRWVLVDDGDMPSLAAAPPGDGSDVASPQAATVSATAPRRGRGVYLLARWLVLAGALGGAWALSLAIVQSRATAAAAAGASAIPPFDPAVAQAAVPTREGAARPVPWRAARLAAAAAEPATAKRSKP